MLLVGPWAIKFPTLRGGTSKKLRSRFIWFCHGVLANETEVDWSGTPGLNPVVRHFGFVNVYRRARPVPDDFWKYHEIETPDWVPHGDEKPENVGIVGGHIVWIDYDWCRCGMPS